MGGEFGGLTLALDLAFPAETPCAGCELICFYAHALEHGDVELAEDAVALAVVRHVSAVLEAPSCEDDGHVFGVVAGAVAEVRAVHDHGSVEQCSAAFCDAFEAAEESGDLSHLFEFDDFELLEFGFVLAVV